MAVPVSPTPTSLVTQALKRAGRTTPSSTQIQEALDHQLQEVKADLMLVASTHPNLLATATTVTTRGQQRYAVPPDHNEQQSITLLDGPDSLRGTCQGGSTTTVIFAATLDVTEDSIVGKYVLITSGSGIEQYREIIAYVPSTKTATIDLDWLIIPTVGTTYLIATQYTQLWPSDIATEFDRLDAPTTIGTPVLASLSGQEFLLYPVPDKSTYGLINRYWVDLSSLDESSTLFTQLLTEWRSLWIQGIAVKSMQRFDEDRYQKELQVYNYMLDALGSQTSRVVQIGYRD
jgi:hypothetical protein